MAENIIGGLILFILFALFVAALWAREKDISENDPDDAFYCWRCGIRMQRAPGEYMWRDESLGLEKHERQKVHHERETCVHCGSPRWEGPKSARWECESCETDLAARKSDIPPFCPECGTHQATGMGPPFIEDYERKKRKAEKMHIAIGVNRRLTEMVRANEAARRERAKEELSGRYGEIEEIDKK